MFVVKQLCHSPASPVGAVVRKETPYVAPTGLQSVSGFLHVYKHAAPLELKAGISWWAYRHAVPEGHKNLLLKGV